MVLHVMLDLETMSLAKDAAIVSVGAVRFDPMTGEVFRDTGFYQVVTLSSSMRSGGRLDAATIYWWIKQGEGARTAILGADGGGLLIETVLKEFNAWFREFRIDGLWGNGSDFDNVILENTYTRLGWTPPWSYRQNRCYRTMAALRPDVTLVREGTFHNALDDAITQAAHLCKIFETYRIPTPS